MIATNPMPEMLNEIMMFVYISKKLKANKYRTIPISIDTIIANIIFEMSLISYLILKYCCEIIVNPMK